MRGMTPKLAVVLVSNLLCIATVLTASSQAAAQPACSQWDLNGEWKIEQSNTDILTFNLKVTPDGIQGTAFFLYKYRAGIFNQYRRKTQSDGSVDGTINGTSIELTIYWTDKTTGIYTGTITPQGRLRGTTYQKEDPENRADWHSERRANCIARATSTGASTTKSAPISVTEPGVQSGGRVRVAEGEPSSTLSKCQAAKMARERHSPAAPGLTEQCLTIVNDLAIKGHALAEQDSAAASLRSRQPNTLAERGFDVGLAAAGGDTENGPGKQAIRDALSPAEQVGFNAAVSFALERNRAKQTESNTALADKGEAIANQDPLTVALRNLQPEGPTRRGFDIGMAAAARDTEPGAGKQRIHDSLLPAEQTGFTAAVTFLLARNKNAKLAAIGAAIAESDPRVARVRSVDGDPFYQLGFDIASGLFGDPALGSVGSTQLGPGSLAIRAGLNAAFQRGFDASAKFHFGRTYR